MKTPPDDLAPGELARALREGWGLGVAAAHYAPLGAGSHHWRAEDDRGDAHWVTVDDLEEKKFLGETTDLAFEGLRRALDAAVALRAAGLEFVLAPRVTAHGESVRPLGERYAIALYPFVEGTTRAFAERLPPAESTQ